MKFRGSRRERGR